MMAADKAWEAVSCFCRADRTAGLALAESKVDFLAIRSLTVVLTRVLRSWIGVTRPRASRVTKGAEASAVEVASLMAVTALSEPDWTAARSPAPEKLLIAVSRAATEAETTATAELMLAPSRLVGVPRAMALAARERTSANFILNHKE